MRPTAHNCAGGQKGGPSIWKGEHAGNAGICLADVRCEQARALSELQKEVDSENDLDTT